MAESCRGVELGFETARVVAMVDTNFSRIAKRSSSLTKGDVSDVKGAGVEVEMSGEEIEGFREVSEPTKTNFAAAWMSSRE